MSNKTNQMVALLKDKVFGINFLSPSFLVFLTTILFLGLLPILPFDVTVPLSANAIMFWFLCFICFWVGTTLGAGKKLQFEMYKYCYSNNKILIFIAIILMIGFFGDCLFLIDRYFIRGISLVDNPLDSREILSQTKPSLISLISVFAYSIGLYSYMLIWIAELNKVKVFLWMKFIAILNIAIVILTSIQLSSRSLLVVLVLSYLFGWWFNLKALNKRINVFHSFLYC